VAVNADFADAHSFNIGSGFVGQFGSDRVALTIVGIVLSPEYVYVIGPRRHVPDNRRFGVVWTPEETLAALYDLDGACRSFLPSRKGVTLAAGRSGS
jgi:putative ABC transport system permease protein